MGTARARLSPCQSEQSKRAAMRAAQERLQRFFTQGWTPEELAQAEADLATRPESPQRQLELLVRR